MIFRLNCTCGHVLYAGAETKEEAIVKFKAMETQEALDKHFSAYHQSGDQKPTLAQALAAIDQNVMSNMEALKITLPAVKAA